MNSSTERILELIEVFKNANPEDNDLFKKSIEEALLILTSDKDLSREFGTGKTTIHRWANGVSSPHPAVRKFVYKYLIDKAENLLIEKLSGI